MRKIKVALLHNIMAPYRFPLFSALAQFKDIELTVLFMSELSKDRKWDIEQYKSEMNFNWKVLPHTSFTLPIAAKTEYLINTSIFSELKTQKYDVVITAGWLDFACQMTYLTKKIFGHKYIIWSESTANESSWQRTLSKPLIAAFVKNADACIAIGTRSKEYLQTLGAKEKSVATALSTVDVPFFVQNSKITLKEKAALRKKLGIPNTHFVLLYVGQFIGRKGVETLLEAVKILNKPKLSLILLGYGPEKEQYQAYIGQHGLSNVKFVDHQEVAELAKTYACADLFVLPSTEETWGLVINEAMACGLPIITTDKVGAAPDLVLQGKNGYTVTANDPDQLAKMIKKLYQDREVAKKMGKKSQEIILKATPQKAALEFRKAILRATGKKHA